MSNLFPEIDFSRYWFLFLVGWHSISARITLWWSSIPGISEHFLSKETLSANNRSSCSSPLVGNSAICSAFITSNDSSNTSLISLQYWSLTILFNGQSMFGSLKSPLNQNGQFLYWSNSSCNSAVNCFKLLILLLVVYNTLQL